MPKDSQDDEEARLAELLSYDILDSAPDPAFDAIVELAAALCLAPISLVSLVEHDRQWFKAKLGIMVPETPIAQSVCTHGLRQDDLLIITDLTQDPRTATNTLVTEEPHMRFYAGAPLRTAGGHALGMLCVIDTTPRPQGLSDEQARMLRLLADQAMSLIDMRRRMHESSWRFEEARRLGAASLARARDSHTLREDVARARLAQEAGRIGTFEMEVATGAMIVSDEFCRIFGIEPGRGWSAARIEPIVLPQHTGDRSSTHTRADGSASLDTEYRIRRPDDGALRWISRRAEFTRDGSGRPVRMFGAVQDITERKLAELRLRALVRLGDALHQAETETEVLAAAGEALGTTLGAARAGYAEADLVGGAFIIHHDWNAPGHPGMHGEPALEVIADRLARMRAGEVLTVPDVEEEEFLADKLARYRRFGIRSKLNVPVSLRGELVGILFVHDSAPRDWTGEEIGFARGVAERIHTTIARLRGDAARRVLNQELSHRLKNTLAMVQALVRQTLATVEPRTQVEALEKRLVALGGAHDELLQQSWQGACILDVVRRMLRALSLQGRVTLKGPAVTLAPRAAMSMTMLLHELSTNAIKHGALSTRHGTVALEWAIEGERFRLSWRERNGPPTQPPAQEGFGSALIQMGLVGNGGVSLEYAPEGLSARFDSPLNELTEP
ncbi:GAF domain-containing protein [Rhodovarius crocodyli]|nr:GAF domain-containing protein [Rhodovarius crocodyli]